MDERKCSTEGCERPYYAKGLCNACYCKDVRYRRKYASEQIREYIVDAPEACTIDGCGQNHHAKGFCMEHYNQIWHLNNKEKRNEAARQRRLLNIESEKEYQKWRKETFPEKVKEEQKRAREKFAANNKEYLREYQREWQRNHPEGAAIRNGRRRTRMTQACEDSYITTQQWKDCLEEFNYCCAYCGNPGTTMDHIIPITKGGKHEIDNVVPACLECNCSKRDYDVLEWLEKKFNK